MIVFDNYDNLDIFPNIWDFIFENNINKILVISRYSNSNTLIFNHGKHFIKLFSSDKDATVILLIQ